MKLFSLSLQFNDCKNVCSVGLKFQWRNFIFSTKRGCLPPSSNYVHGKIIINWAFSHIKKLKFLKLNLRKIQILKYPPHEFIYPISFFYARLTFPSHDLQTHVNIILFSHEINSYLCRYSLPIFASNMNFVSDVIIGLFENFPIASRMMLRATVMLKWHWWWKLKGWFLIKYLLKMMWIIFTDLCNQGRGERNFEFFFLYIFF
jgi:hypothetical protein